MSRSAADRQTRLTVLVALAANLVIAAAKTVGGLVSSPPALLSEAAHSVADSLNEIFCSPPSGAAAAPPTPITRSATARNATSGRSSRRSASS